MVDIPEPHRAALAKISTTLGGRFYLARGVAVAAHFKHRTSRDLDLFSADTDPTELQSRLDEIPGVTVEGRSHDTLELHVDGIPVSLLAYRYPLLEAAQPIDNLPVAVASVCDLACMKLSAIASRGAARDFWDLHTIVRVTEQPLDHYLAAFRRKYPVEDVGHVIRSLAYFGDADHAPLPTGLSAEEWSAIRNDFEAWVRTIALR